MNWGYLKEYIETNSKVLWHRLVNVLIFIPLATLFFTYFILVGIWLGLLFMLVMALPFYIFYKPKGRICSDEWLDVLIDIALEDITFISFFNDNIIDGIIGVRDEKFREKYLVNRFGNKKKC